MNQTRDEILRELFVQTIRGILVSDPVLIKSLLKYDEEKDYSDPLSIPTVGYVEFLLNGGSGPVTGNFRRTFLIPAGTSATDGVLSLVGLTNEQGDQIIPDKPNSSVYDGSSGAVYRLDKTINGLDTDEDGLTVRDVLVVLNGVEPIGNFQNNSVVDIEYAIDGGATSILQSGSSTNISFPNTDLTVRSISDASPDIFIYNQSGKLSDIDGQQTAISSAPNYYIVPSDTSNLYIDN